MNGKIIKNSMHELNEIIPFIRSGKCVFFLGAGISNLAGCLNYSALVERVLKKVNEENLIDRQQFDDLVKSNFSPEVKLQYCADSLEGVSKKRAFTKIVASAVEQRGDGKGFSRAYFPFIERISDIEPIPVIVTTNIDNCLEETHLFDSQKVYHEIEEMDSENIENSSVFHIHGLIWDIKHAVFLKNDYLKTYKNPDFGKFIDHIFRHYFVLFMGFSLKGKDDYLKDIIASVDLNKKHYALSHSGEYSSGEQSLLLKYYRIKIIEYGEKKDFTKIVSKWIDDNVSKKTESPFHSLSEAGVIDD